jgi:hypothetical protein
MFSTEELDQLDQLFTQMEPENLSGEAFTPSQHVDELILEDIPSEPEEEDETESFHTAGLGPFTLLAGSESRMPIAAIDAGVIDLGISRTGFALAFKAAAVFQERDGTLAITKIGPRVKFIAPDNRAELLHFIGEGLMNESMFVEQADGNLRIKHGSTEPNQFKDRIRNFIERILQLALARHLKGGILLIDGALTLRTFNTPQVFLEHLGAVAQSNNSDLVGVSKKSRLTVEGVHIAALLDDDPTDAGLRRILTVDSSGGDADALERNLGIPFAVRFAPGGFTFRVDVARRSLALDEESVLNNIYGNTQMTLGYPNLLRLAHIHSAFTKAEIVMLQVQAAHDYRVSMRQPEDLSVIFAPFRKGLGG